ncbi:MAG: sigma-70 family RNA polymerase sigma factor, partial [Myxococcales bacterium]|nr:sigma-70 family RNA polymerase sigma factor [Myxococcales bacterium]
MTMAPTMAEIAAAPRWEEVAARLRPFVRRRVDSDADADDVLQDALVRIVGGIAAVRDGERVGAWMLQVARSAIAEHGRARARHPLPRSGDAPAERAAPPREAEHGDERDAEARVAGSVALFVTRLPSPYREAVTLTELEGRTQREAAALLGISVSAMKSRVQRGRRRLRELIEACCR